MAPKRPARAVSAMASVDGSMSAMTMAPAVDEPLRPAHYLDVPALLKRCPLSKITVYDLVASPEWCARVHTLRIGTRVVFVEAVEASWLVTR